MATSQKKTTSTTAKKKTTTSASKSTSGSRTASSSTKATSGSRQTSNKNTAQVNAPKPIRREVLGVIMFFLAVFSVLGYFSIDAIFINFFCGGLKGLIGFGYWLVPPALLGASIILLFHRGRPVRLCVVCTILIPLLFGGVLHLILIPDSMGISALWEGGAQLINGGVLSGLMATGLRIVFSGIGAGILLMVLLLIMLMVAFRLTPTSILDFVKSYKYQAYEEEDYEEEKEVPFIPTPKPRKKPVIDIPVDDGPLVAKEPEPAEKKSLFKKNTKVTPDQILTGVSQPAATPTPAAPTPPPVIEEPTPEDLSFQAQPLPVEEVEVPSVVPPVAPAPPPMPEIEREPAVAPTKPMKAKEETAQAAAEVADDIARRMAEEGEVSYHYPPVSLLREGLQVSSADAAGELRANQDRLSDTIRSFGIDATITNVTRGPSVTRYELELDQGVRLNKLTNLSDDIALSLGATGVRIAPIPDQISMVGIEVPNKLVTTVSAHEVIDSKEFRDSSSKVSFSVGKDIAGNNIIGNISKLPHMLIAGTTGSGKSVCTNTLIISLLYKATPDEVRLIMVDPKMVELSIYNGIPHLLIPVVTDPKKAAGALQWAVTEMMKRYRTFSEVGVRDLTSYNSVAAKRDDLEKMPQIVVVIDELADLMLVAAKDVEESICRVAQMGRASGMHLIIATQRPSADVITGLMKANIPSRIAFAVASSLESRIILDNTGAEKLVGRGDMLYFPLGTGKPQRVQGCFISDEEVASVVGFIKENSEGSEYDHTIISEIEKNAAEKDKGNKGSGSNSQSAADSGGDDHDDLLPNAIEVVVDTGMASVSMLQRRLKLGYSRAARLVDQMEEKGVVGPFEGSKPRQVLISKDQWQEMQFKQSMYNGGETPPASEPVPEEFPYEGDAIPQDSPF